MITDIESFLRYFDAVHRRTVRDIDALPPAAGGPLAPAPRLLAPRASRGEGWYFGDPLRAVNSQADWVPCLEEAAAEFRGRLEGTPAEWLARRHPLVDPGGPLSR